MKIGSLFSGYGGLTLATQAVFGGSVAWHSEVDAAASRVLARRWPGVPNVGDITKVDWRDVEPVDVLEGGSPCQDVSAAGRRAGMRGGTRSGLWSSMCDAVDIIRPRLVVWENVRGVLSAPADSDVEPCPWCLGGSGDGEPTMRALGRVVSDLADIGYVGGWVGLRAADVGAPHGRFRVFVVARLQSRDTADQDRGATSGQPREAGSKAGSTSDAHRLGRERPGTAWGWGLRPESSGRSPATNTGCDARQEDDQDGAAAAGDRRTAAPHSDSDALREQPEREPWGGSAPLTGLPGADAPADASGDGWDERGPESAGIVGGSDAALGGGPDWGAFEPAIRRWERVLDRPAPAPTEPGRNGTGRLSPRFVEWMMGLPDGWVTAVPGISRADQLKMLGNGVVPQQAVAGIAECLRMLDCTSDEPVAVAS